MSSDPKPIKITVDAPKVIVEKVRIELPDGLRKMPPKPVRTPIKRPDPSVPQSFAIAFDQLEQRAIQDALYIHELETRLRAIIIATE